MRKNNTDDPPIYSRLIIVKKTGIKIDTFETFETEIPVTTFTGYQNYAHPSTFSQQISVFNGPSLGYKFN